MPDILIRGMEMPKEGNWKTVRIYPDGTCAVPYWSGDCKVLDCTAVPLPEGHGKIGDLDKIVSFIDYYERPMDRNTSPFKALNAVRDYICNAPTIIEAEGGGEDG